MEKRAGNVIYAHLKTDCHELQNIDSTTGVGNLQLQNYKKPSACSLQTPESPPVMTAETSFPPF